MVRKELREHIFKMLFQIEFNDPQEMPEQIEYYFSTLEDAADKDKEYINNMTLNEIWKQLDSGAFVAIYPSCIVNLFYVREIVRDELILKTGDKLFVSKKYCQEVKKRHLRFIKEKG